MTVAFICPPASALGLETAGHGLPSREELGLTAREAAYLDAHPVIRVMTDPAWPPLEFTDAEGRHLGLAIDLLRDIEAMLGVRMELPRFGSWTEGFEALARGDVDMASSIVPTPFRREYLDFSGPYINLVNVIYGGIQSPFVDDLRSLAGKRVAVVDDYAVEEYLRREYPELRLVPAADTSEAVTLLAHGAVDYLVTDIASASYVIQRDGIISIKVVGETPFTSELAMAARKDRAPLGSIMAKAIAAIPADEARRARQAWFNAEIPRKPDPRPYYLAAAIALLLAAAAFAWIKVLSSQVKARTAELAAVNGRLQAEVEEKARAQEELKRTLGEREIFLKELNHRVKNNLQVVLGLVRLSSSEAGERESGALEAAAGRIEAIAKVHEQIESSQMQGRENDRVDLGLYLRELSAGIGESMLDNTAVAVSVRAEPGIEIGLKRAANLGIVVNELLLNARKYAFPDGRDGRIEIGLSRRDGAGLRVVVADDGVGMDTDKPRRQGSLGWTIIHAMAESLGGELEVETGQGKGTRWTLDFPD